MAAGAPTRFAELPLVLLGPWVRRVEPEVACVALALRRAATVELSVWGGDDVVLAGRADTVAIGENLHVVCVSASGPGVLARGATYEYSVSIDGRDLFEPGVVADSRAVAAELLTYPGGPSRPSFVVPPASLGSLRVLFGSCRQMHNRGRDALPAADMILEEAITGAAKRPQLLLLTGDQIYSDSFPRRLTDDLARLAVELTGWREWLPELDRFADESTFARRRFTRRAGQPDPTATHVLSLGEFATMYLLAFSDAPWRALPPGVGGRALSRFRGSMPRVRRALANISTLAMFDDHEILDDWNLTLEWCRNVYGNALGRRICSNGLLSYALFQDWGNRPMFYRDGIGAQVLALAARYRPSDAQTGAEHDEQAQTLLAIPARKALEDEPVDLGDRDGIRWSFGYDAPGYAVRALDNRTERGFASARAQPEILTAAAIERQLGSARDVPLLLISPCPVVQYPVTRGLRFLRGAKYWLGALRYGATWARIYGPDEGDLWRHESDSFDKLIAALADWPAVVIASGDVHCGYAATLSAESSGQRAQVAQLTSSGLCRENGERRWQHRRGFNTPWPTRARLRPDKLLRGQSGATYQFEYLRAPELSHGSEIVGRNNLGDFAFDDDSGRSIRFTLWWRARWSRELRPHSRYAIAMQPSENSE